MRFGCYGDVVTQGMVLAVAPGGGLREALLGSAHAIAKSISATVRGLCESTGSLSADLFIERCMSGNSEYTRRNWAHLGVCERDEFSGKQRKT